mgnify:FL=1
MKKIIIAIIILALLSAGAWYLQNYLNNLSSPGLLDKENIIAATTSSVVVLNNKEEALRAEALKIANAPLRPAKDATAEMIALAQEKIKSSVGLIKQDYNYDLPWLDLGSYRKLVGDYNGAISAWDFLMKIRPKDFVAPHNLGELYGYILSDYQQSEKYFLKSIFRE